MMNTEFPPIEQTLAQTDNKSIISSKKREITINDIPTDVILQIFALLDVQDLGHGMQTQKPWKKLLEMEGLWHHLCKRDFALCSTDDVLGINGTKSWRSIYKLIMTNSLSVISDEICINSSVLSFALKAKGWTIQFSKNESSDSTNSANQVAIANTKARIKRID